MIVVASSRRGMSAACVEVRTFHHDRVLSPDAEIVVRVCIERIIDRNAVFPKRDCAKSGRGFCSRVFLWRARNLEHVTHVTQAVTCRS